ncbi:MAG: hypothetical protein MJY47_08685 [Fibrobacter sp.]|nr:hypothetical protein [Fibrobacter sp.]
MSFENQHGMKGAPGLAFPCVTHSIETGVMQQDKDSEGGFVLWIKTGEAGEAGKVYVDKPENGTFLGIAQRTLYNDSYKAGMTVNVLKKGRLYVRVLGEVKAGDSAYVNETNNAITATSTGAVQIPGGMFKTDAADGELAELEII